MNARCTGMVETRRYCTTSAQPSHGTVATTRRPVKYTLPVMWRTTLYCSSSGGTSTCNMSDLLSKDRWYVSLVLRFTLALYFVILLTWGVSSLLSNGKVTPLQSKVCVYSSPSELRLRATTCHMGSKFYLNPTQVNAPCFNPTWYNYPGGMEGWVDLGIISMTELGCRYLSNDK